MRKRKVRVHGNPYNLAQKRIATPQSLSEADSATPTVRSPAKRLFMVQSFNSSAPSSRAKTLTPSADVTHRRRIRWERLKASLKRIIVFNVCLSLISTILGFLLLHIEFEKSGSWAHAGYAITIGFSVLQIPLIVAYWSKSLKYFGIVNRAYRLDRSNPPTLMKSPTCLLRCTCECLCHLIALIPAKDVCYCSSLFGLPICLCYEEFLYMSMLIRNYHLIRMLYWHSRYSNPRTDFYAKLIYVHANAGFLMRCFFELYSYRLIICVYVVMVMFPGVLYHLLESSGLTHSPSQVWSDWWMIAATQTTLGYGDQTSDTFFGQVMIVVSCFVGVFTLGLLSSASHSAMTLSLSESNLCCDLILGNVRRKQLMPTVKLLQSWWRLMRMRTLKIRNAKIIVSFYTNLGEFRKLLVPRQRIKHGRAEHQFQAFEATVHSKIHSINIYLSPVETVKLIVIATQTHDIFRSEYQIYSLIRRLKKPCRARKILLTHSIEGDASSSVVPSPRSVDNGVTKAKAKMEAHRHLKTRLLEVV